MRVEVLHGVSCVSLLVVLLWWTFTPDGRPFWWKMTQLTGWCLLLTLVFFIMSLLHAVRRVPAAYRDQLFAICIALSFGITVFFCAVLLPFTPKFMNIDKDCVTDTTQTETEACVTPLGFASLVMAHTFPAVFMFLELLAQPHRQAYRNTTVEVGMLSAIVASYGAFSIVWAFSGEDWPYYVQNYLSDHIGLSLVLHLAAVVFFALCYLTFRWIHQRRYKNYKPPHYTEELMLQLQRDFIDIGEDMLPETRVFTNDEELDPALVGGQSTRNGSASSLSGRADGDDGELEFNITNGRGSLN